MKTQKNIHAVLLDYYNLLPLEEIYVVDSNSMIISRADTFEVVRSLMSALVIDFLLIEQTTYTRHRKHLDAFQKSNNAATIILSSKTEAFQNTRLHEFYFINDKDYVIRPISLEDIQHRAMGKNPLRHPINNANKYKFTNALIEKLSLHGAHEFNTPMNGILGVLNLLNEDFNELEIDARKELIHAAISSCIRLKRTYMNLLFSIRGFHNSALISRNKEPKILECVENAIQNLIKEKGYFLFHTRVEDVALPIGEEHLLLLLHEAIDNAIKYGDPSIGFKVEGKVNHSKKKYELSIRDYGDCDDYSFIDLYDAFVQPDRSKSEQQGWGLGLFLIRQLAGIYNIPWAIQPCLPGTALEFSIPLNS